MAIYGWDSFTADKTYTLSDSDRTITLTSDWISASITSSSFAGRKVYFEVHDDGLGQLQMVGVAYALWDMTGLGSDLDTYGFNPITGQVFDESSTPTAYTTPASAGDVIGVAFDEPNGKIWFSVNGVWQASGDPAAGTNEAPGLIFGTNMCAAVALDDSYSLEATFRSSVEGCTYAAPSGFEYVNTAVVNGTLVPATGDIYGVFTSGVTVNGDIDATLPAIESQIVSGIAGTVNGRFTAIEAVASTIVGGGRVSSSLEPVEGNLGGSVGVAAVVDGKLQELTGKLLSGGILSSTLTDLTGTLSGIVEYTGSIYGRIPAMEGEVIGHVDHIGLIDGRLKTLTGSLHGNVFNPGKIFGRLNQVTASITGTLNTGGSVYGILPAVESRIQGDLTGGVIRGELYPVDGKLTGDVSTAEDYGILRHSRGAVR